VAQLLLLFFLARRQELVQPLSTHMQVMLQQHLLTASVMYNM
jgi:hypothetical protein